MKAMDRRLRHLDGLLAPQDSWQDRRTLARLEAARRRCGRPPTSPELQAELHNMSIVEILKCIAFLMCLQPTDAGS
jgi:hypothetical protein